MGGLALTYSLVSGLRASVLSDVAQMLMVVVVALVLVPWATVEAGGLSALHDGLGGVTGEYRDVFDPGVVYSFGIATTIGLISGPIADQMFTQRAFAARPGLIGPIFVLAGLLFAIVPISLSLLGFIGAGAERSGHIHIADAQMVGPEVIGNLLPPWALGLFALMAFAGLTSTLDSAFTAVGSLTAIDLDPNCRSSTTRVRRARFGMCAASVIGMSIALTRPQLLWVFLVYGALAASLFFPTLLLLFWNRLTAQGAASGICAGLVVGTPLSVFANASEQTHLIVMSAILGLLLAGLVAVVVSLAAARPTTPTVHH